MCVCKTRFVPLTPSCRRLAQIKTASHHLQVVGSSWGGEWTMAARILPVPNPLLSPSCTRQKSLPVPACGSAPDSTPYSADEFLGNSVELVSSFPKGKPTQQSAEHEFSKIQSLVRCHGRFQTPVNFLEKMVYCRVAS